MKRATAGLVVSLVLLTPLPAHAAAPDPVQVLRAQVVPGRGVTVSMVTRMSADGRHLGTVRTERVTGFRKGGSVETDESTTVHFPAAAELLGEDFPDFLFPTLLIRLKDANYTSGGSLIPELPLGKKWVRSRWFESSPMDSTVDLFEPGALKALLATASSTGPRSAKGTIYSSKIPGRPFGTPMTRGEKGEKVAWALRFDDRGRVTRLTTRVFRRTNDGYVLGLGSDLRFTGWGSRVTIEAPPEESVIEAEDLPQEPGLLVEEKEPVEASPQGR
ncbi:hypothetical protein HS048_02980 [Planomonospora sp. ID91781]|uniref:hypothetical protein n=1 Tax=Planomonospora sp. ID91781 TaxID=2738135 RepID=UPI0018C36CDB|nr:hypothetical protein [Planomonospora sp. ID91781]MBG0819715.1 hypothetical protein [Planomonospora sp. ID91781]